MKTFKLRTGKSVKKSYFCIFAYVIIKDFNKYMEFGMIMTVILHIRYAIEIQFEVIIIIVLGIFWTISAKNTLLVICIDIVHHDFQPLTFYMSIIVSHVKYRLFHLFLCHIICFHFNVPAVLYFGKFARAEQWNTDDLFSNIGRICECIQFYIYSS